MLRPGRCPVNAQYVVQPWNWPNHLVRYAVPPGLIHSTHSFTWETNRISYQALRGSYSPNPALTNLISTWVFTNAADVPQSGDENIRINLWLINGNAPTDNQEVEFVIKSFTFVPLGPPLPASLAQPRLQNGQFLFEISGQSDRRHQMQLSTDLASWQDLGTFFLTNGVATFSGTNDVTTSPRFYRTITLP